MTVSPVRATAALAALLLGAPAPGLEPAPATPAPLQVSCRAVAGRLLAAVDLSPALGPELERRLGSGLSSSVRLTVAALDAAGAAAATAERDLDIRFDVWSETFTVTIREPGNAAASRLAPDWATVRLLLAGPEPFDLGPLAALPEPFTVEARLELDPVTSRRLEATRQQLTHPAGGPSAGGRSLLGTLAALLLRAPPPEAQRYRSAPLSRAALATP
jgi:hypothetical protein